MTHSNPDPDKTPFKPQVDRIDDGRYLHFRIDLPGIKEEQIRIELEKSTVTLILSGPGKKQETTITAPRGSRLFKKKFSDGVLDICLEKPISRTKNE